MSFALNLHLDFFWLIQSIVLIVLGAGTFAVARLEQNRPWRWFAAFCAVETVHAWIGLIAADLRTGAALGLVQGVIQGVAAVLLWEFARRNPPGARSGIALRRFPVPAVAVAGLALWLSWLGALRWVPAALGLIAGVWSAWALWSAGRERAERAPGGYLRIAALILPVYCITVAIPPDSPAAASFEQLMGTPLFVVSTASLLILSIVLTGRSAVMQQVGLPATEAATWRRTHWSCLAGIAVVLVAGWIAADLAGRTQDAAMREQILVRTRIAAAAIDPALVRELRWSDADLANPGYQRLKALLKAQNGANDDLRFALLTGFRGGRACFLADSEPPDSVDYSPPGQSYDEADHEYLNALAARRPFVQGPVTDRWGTWISGSVPVLELGPVSGVNFELDIAAAGWYRRIRQARLPAVLITLLIVGLILEFFRAHERLRESSVRIAMSEQRASSLVEGSPDCVQLFDLEGRFLSINRNGLRALGLERSNVIGRHFTEIWPTAAQPAIRQVVDAAVRGEPAACEADYAHPDGRMITWRVAANPVRDNRGQVRSFVGTCVDLTARKQAEEALRAAKNAAEAATLSKSEFLAVMSHELRTPLAGVIGMLELLRSGGAKSLQQRYADIARDSAEMLLRILDEILDAAKIESGKLTLEAIPFRLREELLHVCDAVRFRATAKSLEFEHDFAAALPEVLIGDPTRLRQVVANLLNNALKFTERGGVFVKVDGEPLSGGRYSLRIAVRDTGIGISEEAQRRLFDKFSQADATTTRRFGGTGLGLSIVKSLSIAMGGSVGVQSTVGEGSTFTFNATFAIGNAGAFPANLSQRVDERPRQSARLRVLCAEDDGTNRIVAEGLVTALGHTIEFAENGQLAIDRLSQSRFDVVLMDNRMPVMDGLRATDLIRGGTLPGVDTKIYVVATTANVSDADRVRCLAHGMNDFLTKPLRPPDLFAAFERVIAYQKRRGVVLPPLDSVEPAGPAPGLSEAELLSVLDEHESGAAGAKESAGLAAGTDVRLATIFWQEAPKHLARIRSALAGAPVEDAGLAAHALKSSAHYVGAPQLSKLAAEIERFVEGGEPDKLPAAIAAIDREFARLQAGHVASNPRGSSVP
jgi:PAS domain S-box-containing protein